MTAQHAQSTFAHGTSLGHFDELCARVRDAVIAESLPQAVIERILTDMLRREIVVGGLLRLVTTIQLPAIKHFVVADHFRNGVRVGDRAIEVTPSFVTKYGDCVETNVPARLAFIWELLDYAPDPTIIALLGGVDDLRVETRLAHVFHMLALGPERGAYRTDDYGSVGYRAALDNSGSMLNMVNWKVQGYDIIVDAQPHKRMRGWLKNCRVCAG